MISIIIPAHNSENFIEKTINELQMIKDKEIIIVCNNCKDNTYEKVERLKKKNKDIVNLNFPFYTGKGGAILRGISVAKGNVIGFLDADNTFYITDIKNIINLIREYDCVIGSKWKGRYFSSVRQPIKRRIYSRVWNLLVKILFGLDYKDTQAGLKFFRRDVIDKIDKNFRCTGFEFDIELILKIKKAGYTIHEVPARLRHRKKSTLHTIYILPMMWNLIKLRIG